MDNWLKKNWFVKIISFLAALLLYVYVSTLPPTNSLFGFSTSSGNATNRSSKPNLSQKATLNVQYNQKKYIVTGAPDSVTVDIKGSVGLITKAQLARNYEMYIDLSGKGPGTYTVPVQAKGFPDGLNVTPIPQKVTATIQKKETQTYPVQIDLINQSQLANGFEAGTPIVSPSQVTVTAAKKDMSKIAFVEGLVNVEGANDNITQNVALHVYDKKGNEVNAEVSPSVVKVKVPITGDSKVVPIQIQKNGTLPDGLSVTSIDLEPSQVTMFGSKKSLKGIDYVKLPVDLSNIKDNTTMMLNLMKPNGVNKLAPVQVKVTVNVSKQTTKTINNVSVKISGKSDGQNYQILKPKDQTVDITLSGAKDVLKTIKKSDLQVYVDASSLSTGDHMVPIQINPVNNNVQAVPSVQKAEVQVNQGTSH